MSCLIDQHLIFRSVRLTAPTPRSFFFLRSRFLALTKEPNALFWPLRLGLLPHLSHQHYLHERLLPPRTYPRSSNTATVAEKMGCPFRSVGDRNRSQAMGLHAPPSSQIFRPS